MLETAEIRWFLPWEDRDYFLELFPRVHFGKPQEEEEARTDRYHVVAGVRVVGLKQRKDEKLEIKALRGGPEPFCLPPDGKRIGSMDCWAKWDLPETKVEQVL